MLLSKREQGLLQLLLEETEYLPAVHFQKKLYVSSKTIYTDLTHLEEKLEGTGLHISRLPRKGIKIEGESNARKKVTSLFVENTTSFDEYSPEYRKVFIFANYLFSEKPMTYQALADYFFVSHQSIKKDVDEIIRFCQDHEVNACLTHSHLILDSDECSRQRVFKSLLDYYIDNSNLDAPAIQSIFQEKTVALVSRFVSDLAILLGRPLNSYFVDSLLFSLEIFLSRAQLGYHIVQQSNLVFDEMNRMKLYMQGISFAEKSAVELMIQLTDEDVQYICSLLLAHGVEPYLKVTNNKDKMLLVTNKMIRNMSELLDVDLTDNELLGQALIAHIVPMIHRLRNNILIINPLRDSIKKQYSTMFTLTKFVIGDLEREYEVSLIEDEVTFLTIHFQLAFERIRVTKHILIVCHSGLATSELIFNRVKAECDG